MTGIDCHKGIAHTLPAECDPENDRAGESVYHDKADTTLWLRDRLRI